MRIVGDSYDNGYMFYTRYDSEDEITYYPSTQTIDYWAVFDLSESSAHYWSSKNTGYNSWYLDLRNMWVGINSEFFSEPVYGKSVRCMKDEGHKDISTHLEMGKVHITDVTVSSANITSGYKYATKLYNQVKKLFRP